MTLHDAAENLLEAWDNGTHNVVDALEILRAALKEEEFEIDVAMMKGMDKGRELEREACLKIIERYQATKDSYPTGDLSGAWMVTAFEEIKATIRARGINE